ncbi:hypothetical protein [Ignavibacterium sp.]|uniref:hypothetical protein n=1 Tax=Ignavibacterium sp. TaxID=2651167 RepID=UPI00307E2CE0
MKKIIFGAAVILFVTTGCLQVDTKVFVNKDGSGIIEENVLIKNEVLEMMKQFVMAFDSTKAEEFNFFQEEELISKASQYGEGVTFLSSEKLKSENFEGVRARYSFQDISKVNLSLVADDQLPALTEESAPKDESELLKFVLDKTSAQTNLKIFLPSMKNEQNEDIAEEDVDDSTSNENFEKVKEIFADMKVSLRIIPSENIKQTNADFVDDNQVTLIEMNLNSLINNPDLFKDLSGNKIKSLDEFRKAVKDLEGFKIESKNEIKISF